VDEQIRLLEHMHNHDVLTGLPNRSFIFEHLDFICSECDAHNCMVALMVVNIDGFKRINDLHGHRSGDHVLKEIALRIRQSCSPSDVVARIGADEFAVVVADIKDYRAISALAKTTLTALQEPLKVRKSTISVTACVGIVVLPIDAISAAEALQKSDSAVDEAKSQGISQFSFFNAQQQRQAIEKMQLEEQLAQAAERDEYVLHFQPIVKLRRDVASTTTAAPEDGDSLGFEALIRWQSADRGLLFPDQFIDAAENSGAIVALGYWVVEAACLQLLQCDEGCWISVNLSPKQLAAPELVGKITDILERTGVDAKRLTVEVTESCFIRDVTVAISTLRKLKKLGLNIALDDFGTGFSSLSLLQKLPVDKLKIDRSFIEKLQQDDRDRQIVHGLILIAHKLGLEVIAEGVEQGEHEDILKQMQCDYGQGYFYSKPAAAEEINHWRQQYRSA
jgi:diguanylate cyclase (GGDEF)-like protein